MTSPARGARPLWHPRRPAAQHRLGGSVRAAGANSLCRCERRSGRHQEQCARPARFVAGNHLGIDPMALFGALFCPAQDSPSVYGQKPGPKPGRLLMCRAVADDLGKHRRMARSSRPPLPAPWMTQGQISCIRTSPSAAAMRHGSNAQHYRRGKLQPGLPVCQITPETGKVMWATVTAKRRKRGSWRSALSLVLLLTFSIQTLSLIHI